MTTAPNTRTLISLPTINAMITPARGSCPGHVRPPGAERPACAGSAACSGKCNIQTPLAEPTAADRAASADDAAARSVLSTLNPDGTRRWLCPKPSHGKFWNRRRALAYVLIALYAALPWIPINGHPAVLLDLATRRFHIFGATFLPTDTLLLALLLVGIFVSVFLFTAVLGRVWCGWACPQTVYMEFLYRPIERFFEGTPGRAKKGILQTTALGSILKYAAFLVISAHLANTFLAYFVGVDNMMHWTLQSPLQHVTPFLVFAVVTALMMFDFAFFREQTCIVACPYGRMQSALLDKGSLIVSYDRARGEPRGRKSKAAHSTPSDPAAQLAAKPGDCVDCGLCVATCPTGIDIRNGLQMECIHCTQCIDACDAVMTKLSRPTGLIRYASQNTLRGEPNSFLRPRVLIYPAILAIVAAAFIAVLVNKAPVEFRLLRARGTSFVALDDGRIANNLSFKFTNRRDTDATYRVEPVAPAGLAVIADENPVALQPGQMKTVLGQLALPPDALRAGPGAVDATVRIVGDGYQREVHFKMFGPATTGARP